MTKKRSKCREHQLDIVAIGASAGGVEAISELIAHLPGDLVATVLVVLHRPPDQISQLTHILARKTDLRVRIAQDGDPLQKGVCLIGEPNRHLTIGRDLRIHLLPDSFYRAHTIDALFCSLARVRRCRCCPPRPARPSDMAAITVRGRRAFAAGSPE
jgi:two-component system chemotaxis response regulator CheB